MRRWRNLLLLLFWVAAILSVAIMAKCGPAGWDYKVYWRAAQALHSRQDPYALGIAAQQAFHERAVKNAHIAPPMTYVYPPLTFSLLRLAGNLPPALAESIFFALLLIGFALQLWAGWQLADVAERAWLPWMLPAVAFFPGLLNDDVLLSGNIAYLLYGLMLAAAVPGWKRNRWGLFYCAVFFASCFKAPLLYMLAFPLFVGRRQFLPATLTGLFATILFCAQAQLWPVLFHEYLTAVRLQFDFNCDFGFSPSGILGNLLFHLGQSYSLATTALYVAFAAVILLFLLWTAKVSRINANMRQHWIAVALVGTFLLNPRIKEYDVAALTLPLTLIAARLLDALVLWLRPGSRDLRKYSARRALSFEQTKSLHPAERRGAFVTVFIAAGWFLAANFGANGDTWKPLELSIIVLAFAFGSWNMLRANRATALTDNAWSHSTELLHGAHAANWNQVS